MLLHTPPLVRALLASRCLYPPLASLYVVLECFTPAHGLYLYEVEREPSRMFERESERVREEGEWWVEWMCWE